MNFPVFDLHCDTALELLGRGDGQNLSLKKNNLHIDLERASSLPGYVQCFACFTTPEMSRWFGVPAEDIFIQEKEGILRALDENKSMIRQVRFPCEIEENQKKGIISVILTIEGPAGFGFDPGKLSDLYHQGFRITTLGWNESNVLTGSHISGEGLTELGREYVRRAQHLGMIVDVSHISDQAFWDIMQISSAPVIASHSNSRSVWNVSRNLTDEMFKAICSTGGVTGINLYAEFLGNDADLNTVCDHILHFLQLDPDGKHIALGGDLDGCEKLPAGFFGVQDYSKLANALLERGLSEKTVLDIFWNNAMGVMERCCM